VYDHDGALGFSHPVDVGVNIEAGEGAVMYNMRLCLEENAVSTTGKEKNICEKPKYQQASNQSKANNFPNTHESIRTGSASTPASRS
jgi:hypothetical protein